VLAETLLFCLVASADPAPARAELDACAARIEALKARGEDGAELDRLLRRAQELAAELERATSEVRADAAPSPEELRERADAARDQADRLASELAALDVKLEDARRAEADGSAQVRHASVGGAAAAGDAKVRELLAARAALVERRARALAEAARLDGEARQAERER